MCNLNNKIEYSEWVFCKRMLIIMSSTILEAHLCTFLFIRKAVGTISPDRGARFNGGYDKITEEYIYKQVIIINRCLCFQLYDS